MIENHTNSAYIGSLLRLLDNSFNDEELRALCFEAKVDYDNLPAQGKKNKAMELIQHMSRNGRLSEMIAILERERPNVNWREGSSQESVISEYVHLHFSARPFAALTGKSGPGSGSYIFLTEQSRRIIIGREAKNISIDDSVMSRQHCLIQVVPDEDPEHRQRRYRVYILDLGSANGTFVDGAKITERTPLANGSKIQIGASTFIFAEMPDFS